MINTNLFYLFPELCVITDNKATKLFFSACKVCYDINLHSKCNSSDYKYC